MPTPRHLRDRVIALVVAAVAALPAAAQTRDETVEDRLRRMQEELDGLRDENSSMRSEIDELRSMNDDGWLTEARANQIRGLVADVLADADSRSALLNDGMSAGWSDGFFLASPDGRFKLNVGGEMQVRWIYNYHDQPDRHRQGFENARTRMTFSGHVFNPDITFMVRTAITSDETGLVDGLDQLRDAWIRFNFSNDTSLRIGQFKLPFMREELVASTKQLAVERSLINETYSVERSQGVEITFLGPSRKLSLAFSDAGTDQIFRTQQEVIGNPPNMSFLNPINAGALVEDVEYTLSFRHEHLLAGQWDQFDDFTSPPGSDYGVLVGIAGFYQQGEYGTPSGTLAGARNESRWLAWTADISTEYGGASSFVSYTHTYTDTGRDTPSGIRDNLHFHGIVAQGAFYLTPKVELFGRFEYGWLSPSNPFRATFPNFNISDLTLLTVGTNYYIDGHDLKWTTDFGYGISQIEFLYNSELTGYRQDADTVDGQIVFRTQFQLVF